MEKYTVIIPVKDSGDTIGFTLETCLRQTYDNFYIVVSDNFSSDRTREIVESLQDPRLSYVNTGRRVSMAENFDFALSHVVDGYVMFIGGDDGLLPGAIEYVNEIVQRYSVTAVSCRWAHYVWPNFPDDSISGDLKLCGFGNETHLRGGVEIRRSDTWLAKTLSYQSLYVYDLANLYYGFVHRDVINMSVVDGVYFRSITPDAYGAYATTLSVDTYAFSYRPFCICGASGKSNGASAFNEKTKGDEVAKFVVENVLPVHKDFVFCPSLEILATETLFQFLDVFPEQRSKVKIDIALMLSKAKSSVNSKTRAEVFSAIEKMAAIHGVRFPLAEPRASAELCSFVGRVGRQVHAVWSGFFGFLGVKKSTRIGVGNISEASTILGFLFQLNNGVKPDRGYSVFFRRVISFLRRVKK